MSAMREELPRLKAIQVAGDRWPLRRLAARPSRFLGVVAWIERFAQAIAPRALDGVLRDVTLAGVSASTQAARNCSCASNCLALARVTPTAFFFFFSSASMEEIPFSPFFRGGSNGKSVTLGQQA